MLKPRGDERGPETEGLGELFHRLVEDAKVYARAEVELYKTIGSEKARAYRTPVILLVVALFLAHAGALTLVATLFIGLARLMNPVLAGVATTLILFAAGGILAKVAMARLKEPTP